jgi:hypothetical protein
MEQEVKQVCCARMTGIIETNLDFVMQNKSFSGRLTMASGHSRAR